MNVRDEVCGMEFPADQAVATTKYAGRLYHFCAERCKKLFQENPHWYVEAVTPKEAPPSV